MSPLAIVLTILGAIVLACGAWILIARRAPNEEAISYRPRQDTLRTGVAPESRSLDELEAVEVVEETRYDETEPPGAA